MINLIGIKCKDKILISIFEPRKYSVDYRSPKNYIINGNTPQSSFHEDWCIIDQEPKTVEQIQMGGQVNERFELIDPSLHSDKIPLSFFKEEVLDEECEWKEEYLKFKSLYRFNYDQEPDYKIKIDFTYKTILEIEEVKEFNKIMYKGIESGKEQNITEENVQYQLLDKILFPEIILPSKPCELSAEDSYKIIRQYIKENINNKVAEITSDYDFCFAVAKKIKLFENEEYKVDINYNYFSKKRKKPKWEKRYRKNRLVKIFEMAPKEYNNYPIINEFRGKDHNDLQKNIDSYLNILIDFINEPIEDCPHCKGEGVVIHQLKENKQ